MTGFGGVVQARNAVVEDGSTQLYAFIGSLEAGYLDMAFPTGGFASLLIRAFSRSLFWFFLVIGFPMLHSRRGRDSGINN